MLATLGFLLLLGARPLLYPQYTPTHPHSPIVAVCTIPGTYNDCFTSTGVLTTPWESSIGFPTATMTQIGTGARATSSGGFAQVTYTGGTFGAAQSSRVVVTPSSNLEYTGPCVRFDPTTGNGYCWLMGIGSVYIMTGGSGGSVIASSCPAHNSSFVNDTFELAIDSTFNVTCTDITNPSFNPPSSGIDMGSTYATGKPGFTNDRIADNSTVVTKWGGS